MAKDKRKAPVLLESIFNITGIFHGYVFKKGEHRASLIFSPCASCFTHSIILTLSLFFLSFQHNGVPRVTSPFFSSSQLSHPHDGLNIGCASREN